MRSAITLTAGLSGIINVLNVSDGDTELRFDQENPDDVERAKKIVQDMLRRGFALFVDTPIGPMRVLEFDPDTCRYMIYDDPEFAAVDQIAAGELVDLPVSTRRRGRPRRSVSATKAKATAIGRSAGG